MARDTPQHNKTAQQIYDSNMMRDIKGLFITCDA